MLGIRPAHWAVIFLLGAAAWAVIIGVIVALATAASGARVDYVVDGDTLRLESGAYVRFIGIDTPERGDCGYAAAKAAVDRMVGDRVELPNPRAVEDTDFYGRLLRYVEVDGRDVGLALLRTGLARARYDSRDGYGAHPRERAYHRADRLAPDVC